MRASFHDEISIAVLSGQSIAAVVWEFELPEKPNKTASVSERPTHLGGFVTPSKQQIPWIVNHYCLRANPTACREVFRHCPLLAASVAALRQSRDHFLPRRPATEPLDGSSSIWCIPDAPGNTIVGLYRSKMDTIDDLMKTPVEEMIWMQRVGVDGLTKVLCSLQAHGFAVQTLFSSQKLPAKLQRMLDQLTRTASL